MVLVSSFARPKGKPPTNMSKIPHILTVFVICAYAGLFVVLVKDSAPHLVNTELAPMPNPEASGRPRAPRQVPHAAARQAPHQVPHQAAASTAQATHAGHQGKRVLAITEAPLVRAPHPSLATSLNEDLYKAPPGVFPLLLLLLTWLMISSIGRVWRPDERFRDYRPRSLRVRAPSCGAATSHNVHSPLLRPPHLRDDGNA
jgi:hypothetical protein